MSRQVQAIKGQSLDPSETTTAPLAKEANQMDLALAQLPEGSPPRKQGAESAEIPSELGESDRRQSSKLPPEMESQAEPPKEPEAEHAEKQQEEQDDGHRGQTHETKAAKTAAQSANDAKHKLVKPAPQPEPEPESVGSDSGQKRKNSAKAGKSDPSVKQKHEHVQKNSESRKMNVHSNGPEQHPPDLVEHAKQAKQSAQARVEEAQVMNDLLLQPSMSRRYAKESAFGCQPAPLPSAFVLSLTMWSVVCLYDRDELSKRERKHFQR
eukprot:COSAG02_NODE_778_length_17288_cov_102.024725_2_plen_267_part_00